MQSKELRMKNRHIKSFLLALTATMASYLGLANPIDPAVPADKLNVHKDVIVSEIENGANEKIFVKVGNDHFGLHHILKRHSKNYSADSLKGILFPDGTSAYQIIKGIEKVYKFGKEDTKNKGNKKVLHHSLSINGERSKYRLVINDNNEVITFYKLKK